MTSDRGSVFIHCPKLARYPPQPVRACELYEPRPVEEEGGGAPR